MKKDSFIRQIYTSDNLPVLRSMDSETVDLIYLDPPFNSGKQWANPVEADGRQALASFKDTWELSDSHPDEEYALGQQYPAVLPLIDSLYAINGSSWKAYLIYMGVRLAEMRRILKPTGSIYYHCDRVMSHGIKLLMDAIFVGQSGSNGKFRNEIVWHYGGTGKPTTQFPAKHEVLLFYAKTKAKNKFNPIRVPAKKTSGWTGRNDKLCDTVWDINTVHNSPERNDGIQYPTRKPFPLLARVVEASSDKGDLVLDPFCGCATACHAAESLERQWIGIDFGVKTARFIVKRLQSKSDKQLKASFANIEHIVVKGRKNLPTRTDLKRRTDAAVFKPKLYRLQGEKCAGPCGDNGEGRPLPIDALEFDHIIARSRGGQDVDDNLQLLCRNCNTTKSDRGMDYLRRNILKRRSHEAMREWRREWESKKDKLDSLRDDD